MVDRSDLYDVVLSCQKTRVEYGGRMWMWMVVGEEDGDWGLQEAGLKKDLIEVCKIVTQVTWVVAISR